jgi:hydroxylamine dehydrogenase
MNQQAERVVEVTNQRVAEAKAIVDGLKQDGVLKGAPFSSRIDFLYFDLWHYDGRTSKHGAFMGGADFVQWHGNYPMLSKMVELKSLAQDLRTGHGHAR